MAPKRAAAPAEPTEPSSEPTPVNKYECPCCLAEIQDAHRQVMQNPASMKRVDLLMQQDPELTLGEAIIQANDQYWGYFFSKLVEMKAETGSVPQWLKFHLAQGMTEIQQKRLEAL